MYQRYLGGATRLILIAVLLAGCDAWAGLGRDDRTGRDNRAPTSSALPSTPLPLATWTPAGAGLPTEAPQIQTTPSQPGAGNPCGGREEIIKVVSVGPLQPDNFLLQLAWEGGLARPEFALGGRVPEFTLLTDGRAFYGVRDDPPLFDRGQVMAVRLTPAERQELVQRVLDLGFERLESYPDSCRPLPGGMCECVEDGNESILRLRLAKGRVGLVRLWP